MPLLIAILGGSKEQGLDPNDSIIIDTFVSEVKRIMPYKRRLSADTSQHSTFSEEPAGKTETKAAENNSRGCGDRFGVGGHASDIEVLGRA